jgi:ribosomal protein S12 methylthiotransferase
MSPLNSTPAVPSGLTNVGMISLGCAKNLVDAEIMLGSVLERGMQVTPHADEADVLVVNTCAFIDSAKEESIEAILEAHQQRELGKRPNQKLIVSGCMSQRFAAELRAALPEVDAFIGLDQVRELGAIVERVLAGMGDPGQPANNRNAGGITIPATISSQRARLTSRIGTRRAFVSRPRTAST